MCDVNLVVSRCDEDVDWLMEVASSLGSNGGDRRCVHVFVYDKGTTDLPSTIRSALDRLPAVCVHHTRLLNVGRESHTYLEHVLRIRTQNRAHCVCGDGVTVFLQGKMQDHVPGEHDSIASFVVSLVDDASCSALGESGNHGCHTQYGSFNAVPGLRVSMFPGVGSSGCDLGTWFARLLGRPWKWSDPREGPPWWQHGVFALRTSRLVSPHVDDDYYRSLLAQVDWHVNPEAGHFFERSWCFVFPPLRLCTDHRMNGVDDIVGNETVGV